VKELCFFISLLFLVQATALAQKPVVAITADKSKIVIGEPIQLRLQADFEKGQPVSFFAIDSIAHFDVIEKGPLDSQVTGQGLQFNQQITVTSWDSGRWQIPAFTLQGVRTKPFAVTVSYTDFNTQQPYHDVKPVIEVAPPKAADWPWYAAGIALLLILCALFFPGSKGEKKPDGFIAEKGAYKKALKRLDALNEDIETTKEGKLFFTELIELFRQYLWERKGIASASQTTAELSQLLQTLHWPDGAYRHLSETLELSDAVKFAQATVTATGAKAAKETIKQSITAVENMNNGIRMAATYRV
jgi:hypothetical protein